MPHKQVRVKKIKGWAVITRIAPPNMVDVFGINIKKRGVYILPTAFFIKREDADHALSCASKKSLPYLPEIVSAEITYPLPNIK